MFRTACLFSRRDMTATLLYIRLLFSPVCACSCLQNGWMSPFAINCSTGEPNVYLSSSVGVIDFAGSASVHITGGAAAFAGAAILQPRSGRFSETGHHLDMSAHNPVLQVLGTMLLWLGWCACSALLVGDCLLSSLHERVRGELCVCGIVFASESPYCVYLCAGCAYLTITWPVLQLLWLSHFF